MEKDRILYIDRLRGVNILLVVMGHVITSNVINGEETGILVWGSTFRMPLFMFLCGYIASKVIKPKIFMNYGAFVLKKCRTLLVPFFAWPLLVDNFFFSDQEKLNFWNTILELINGGGLWFLWYLFFITLLYSFWLFFSNKLNKNDSFLWDFAIWIMLLLGLGFIWHLGIISYMKQFLFFFMFYFFGVFVAKYSYLAKVILDKRTFTVAILLFVLLVDRYDYGVSSPENTVIKLLCAISGITIFYYLIKHSKWNTVIDKYIRNWGIHSLIIYVTHFYVVSLFSTPFISSEMNEISLFIFTGLLTLSAAFVSMEIFRILKMSNLLNFLLYGNRL